MGWFTVVEIPCGSRPSLTVPQVSPWAGSVIEMHCGSIPSLTVFLTVSDLMSHNALGWFRVVQMHCGFMPSLKVSEDPYF